ncbi:MAG: EscU/YscU/HrcU family type III secretion system export apparatus switch protein, partial [bacterium]
MPEDTGQERTEEATPRRRREARQRGQVARSQEVNSVAVLLGGMLLLFLSAPAAYHGILDAMRYGFAEALGEPVTPASAPGLFAAIIARGLGSLAPFAGGLVVVAAAASYGQVGFLITPEALQPRLSNLDPVKGAKRIVSVRALMRSAFSLGKLAILVAVFALAVWSRMDEFFPLAESQASVVFGYLCRTTGVVCLQAFGVLVVVALADLGYQRWEHERSLRMTREELKEEMKRLEGERQVEDLVGHGPHGG